MRLGIVLAAGDATRLPGKLTLPIKQEHHGTPLASAVRFLQYGGRCDKVVAVVKSVVRNPLATYLDACLHVDHLVLQLEASGVTDALRCVQRAYLPYAWEPVTSYLVVFGDNVYQDDGQVDELPDTSEPRGLASVRDVEDRENQLDGWSVAGESLGWVTRAYHKRYALAGWLHLPKPVFDKVAVCWHLIGGLNHAEVQPILCNSPWWDIGTPAAYERYWRGK